MKITKLTPHLADTTKRRLIKKYGRFGRYLGETGDLWYNGQKTKVRVTSLDFQKVELNICGNKETFYGIKLIATDENSKKYSFNFDLRDMRPNIHI